jgi:K+-sensing histidine kinase KdpD
LLANLLANAIRYATVGGSIDCAIPRDPDGRAFVAITDTGPGVRAEDLPRHTDPFFRAADAGADGSYLGLSIADAIVQRHQLNLAFANSCDCSGLLVRVLFQDRVDLDLKFQAPPFGRFIKASRTAFELFVAAAAVEDACTVAALAVGL